ncbi:MAG: DUF3825 domain-containing protein [bacterium]
MSYSESTPAIPAIFRFAFFPKYEDCIKFLAETMSDKEPWDFSDSGEKKYAILKNYLDYYYRKLKEESKIFFTKDNQYCIFNTGLVTNNQEDIFAFFEANKSTRTNSSPYYFKCFLKHSDPLLLEKFGESLPECANFFDKPELLILNPKYKIVPDIEHIITDNKTRFPSHLQNADNAELRRQLKGAIDDVTKKVRTNYKIAIPQYYDGKVQLLLPLCLTSGSPNPDLALVVSKVPGQEIYSAKTCLTLKMAYNNARLIVKPQSDWLKP